MSCKGLSVIHDIRNEKGIVLLFLSCGIDCLFANISDFRKHFRKAFAERDMQNVKITEI